MIKEVSTYFMNESVIKFIEDVLKYVTLTNVSEVSKVFLNITTGVCAIIGIGYLRKLREKRNLSVYSFWQQIRVRIGAICSWLESDYSLINNLYTPEIRLVRESELTEDPNRIEEFKKLAIQTLEYIKQTPDQMPAYRGWTEDYTVIIEFLDDVIRYDISNPDNFFKFIKDDDIKIDAYCNGVIECMQRLCKEIKLRQIKTEKKLSGKRMG